MHLYLVRHGETDWNLQRRIQGATDIPLNATGRAQARVTGRRLAQRSWDAIYTSPLSRARETAALIADEVGLDAPVAVPELVERNYGEAEGLAMEELDRRFPPDTPVPGREPREAVAARVVPALLALAERHPGQSIIVVSHGGVIRAVLSAVDPGHEHPRITNGSVHSFVHEEGGLSLVAFDDPITEPVDGPITEELVVQNTLERREPESGAAR